MRWLVIWGDEPVPVTNLFDDDNDETADLEDAVTFVAGPLETGGWLSGLIADHDFTRPH